jgi:hypothetical protein
MRISLACHRKTLFDEDRRLLGADGVAAGRILDAVTGSKPGFAHGIDAVDAGAVGTAGVAMVSQAFCVITKDWTTSSSASPDSTGRPSNLLR